SHFAPRDRRRASWGAIWHLRPVLRGSGARPLDTGPCRPAVAAARLPVRNRAPSTPARPRVDPGSDHACPAAGSERRAGPGRDRPPAPRYAGLEGGRPTSAAALAPAQVVLRDRERADPHAGGRVDRVAG